jgi:hypothetical protein
VRTMDKPASVLPDFVWEKLKKQGVPRENP